MHLRPQEMTNQKFSDINGLSATQKTIRNDISKLIEAGFEIEEYSEPGKPTHYSCRLTFEKPELKMIIDAVMAANFISASKCQQLVEKLMSLAGENAKDVLSSGTDTSSHLTKPNAGFFINIDTISEATVVLEADNSLVKKFIDQYGEGFRNKAW